MDARDLAKCAALDRIVYLVEAHDALRAAAAESKAVSLLRKRVDELKEIAEFQAAAAVQSPLLTAHRKELRTEIAELMVTISVAAKLGTNMNPVLSVLTKLPVYNYDMTYVIESIAFAGAAKRMIDSLADAGLEPNLPDEIIALASELNEVAGQQEYLSIQLEAKKRYLPTAFENVFRTFVLVRRQLRHAITPMLADEWKVAAALGRTHRPKAIAAPRSRRLLGTGTESQVDSPSTPDETGLADSIAQPDPPPAA